MAVERSTAPAAGDRQGDDPIDAQVLGSTEVDEGTLRRLLRIPDFIPAAGFSDDLVALTALLGLCATHMSDDIRLRAQRKLDSWFPPGR